MITYISNQKIQLHTSSFYNEDQTKFVLTSNKQDTDVSQMVWNYSLPEQVTILT